MTIKSTVATLTHTAVSTAVNAARHPLDTTARATGLVKETAGAGIGLVRNRIGGAPKQAPAPAEESTQDEHAAPVQKKPVQKAPAKKAAPKKAAPKKAAATKPAAEKAEDPRDQIPGPDLAAFAPPAPEDLPEPIVIEAEPTSGPTSESTSGPTPEQR